MRSKQFTFDEYRETIVAIEKAGAQAFVAPVPPRPTRSGNSMLAYDKTTISAVAAATQPPIVATLQSIFASLDDEHLIEALIGPTRRGPKGHPVRTIWQCVITRYVLGLGFHKGTDSSARKQSLRRRGLRNRIA